MDEGEPCLAIAPQPVPLQVSGVEESNPRLPCNVTIIKKMKTLTIRNNALALVGLLALTVYVLACTSFSPDDSKVLYPAFDPDNGALGMSIYDRPARRAEMVFVPPEIRNATNGLLVNYLRGEWLADGRSVVIAFSAGKEGDDSLDLALIPSGARAPFKLFHLDEIKNVGAAFTFPLCVVGNRVFLSAGEKQVVRLDLKTGVVVRQEFEDLRKDITLFPAADGGVFYFESMDAPQAGIFGRLNPETFARSPLMDITNATADNVVFAYAPNGKCVAFLQNARATNQLMVWRKGQPSFSRDLPVAKDEELAFGNAGFSVKGDMIWATCQRRNKAKQEASYGLMEIPLDSTPLRETTLIASAPAENDSGDSCFQGSISHNGKTFAVDSTYLACVEPQFKANDCALFFVDLKSPNRKVTKVPIPLPAKRPELK
jgi:hypothetical protein